MQIYVVHFLEICKDGTSSSYVQNAYANENKAYINAIIFNAFDTNKKCRLNFEEMDKNQMKLECEDILKDFVGSTTESDFFKFKNILDTLSIEELKKINNWLFFFNTSRSKYMDTSVAEISECTLEDIIF
jgi:hypothetical protein